MSKKPVEFDVSEVASKLYKKGELVSTPYDEVKELVDEHNISHANKWCMYFWIVQGASQKKMRKGKAAGQVAHAAARLARSMSTSQWETYLNYEVKIVYKVSTPEQLNELYLFLIGIFHTNYVTLVYDETWGAHTVVGLVTQENLTDLGEWKLA